MRWGELREGSWSSPATGFDSQHKSGGVVTKITEGVCEKAKAKQGYTAQYIVGPESHEDSMCVIQAQEYMRRLQCGTLDPSPDADFQRTQSAQIYLGRCLGGDTFKLQQLHRSFGSKLVQFPEFEGNASQILAQVHLRCTKIEIRDWIERTGPRALGNTEKRTVVVEMGKMRLGEKPRDGRPCQDANKLGVDESNAARSRWKSDVFGQLLRFTDIRSGSIRAPDGPDILSPCVETWFSELGTSRTTYRAKEHSLASTRLDEPPNYLKAVFTFPNYNAMLHLQSSENISDSDSATDLSHSRRTFPAMPCNASSAFCAVLDPRNLQFLAFRCNEDCVAEMFSSFLETTAWHYTRPHHFRERRSLNNPYLSAHHVPVLTWSESKVPHAGVPSREICPFVTGVGISILSNHDLGYLVSGLSNSLHHGPRYCGPEFAGGPPISIEAVHLEVDLVCIKREQKPRVNDHRIHRIEITNTLRLAPDRSTVRLDRLVNIWILPELGLDVLFSLAVHEITVAQMAGNAVGVGYNA
ncbi:hypothetical protein B0H13DRAFT_1898711 [Mycena leptocephala]|nr:hypothetical protein B0H13DRAFT_1898711 [Mycena leptocephala]